MFRVLIILCILAQFSAQLRAQETNAPALQQQLDELKRGQERILQELQSLRSAVENSHPAKPVEQPARRPTPAVLNVHGEPFKGQTNAPIAIVEYSDFDCSHCAQFATEIFPELDRKYVATGKVRFYFRDLPEAGNAESLLKAQLARCAGEQGKFWEMHNYLFAARPTLIGSKLEREAEVIGLDPARLTDCLKAGKYSEVIQRSSSGAMRMGFGGTPTFVIGLLTDGGSIVRVKEVVLGVESMRTVEKVLDDLISGASVRDPKK